MWEKNPSTNLPWQCLPPSRQILTFLIFCKARGEDKIDKPAVLLGFLAQPPHPSLLGSSSIIPLLLSAVDHRCYPDLPGNLAPGVGWGWGVGGRSKTQIILNFTPCSFLFLTLEFLLSRWMFGPLSTAYLLHHFLPLPAELRSSLLLD